MNENERKEQEKNRSYMIELNEVNEDHENGGQNGKKNGLFEIQNTLQEENNTSTNGHDSHYKLFNADTDVDENNVEDEANEKSSRFNNTSAGTDFHLEMSASILHPNQSIISNNKSTHEQIPDTIVDEEEDNKITGNEDIEKEPIENKSENKDESDMCKLNGNHEQNDEVGDTLVINQESNEKCEATVPIEKVEDENEKKNLNKIILVGENNETEKTDEEVTHSVETIEKEQSLNDEKKENDSEFVEVKELVKENVIIENVQETQVEENKSDSSNKIAEEIKPPEELVNSKKETESKVNSNIEKQTIEENQTVEQNLKENVVIEESSQKKEIEQKNIESNDNLNTSIDLDINKIENNQTEENELIEKEKVIEVIKDEESAVTTVENDNKPIEESTTAPKRGRRSVAKPPEIEEEQSTGRPKRSVRTSIATPTPSIAVIPKTKAESKRKSVVVSEPEPVVPAEPKNESKEEPSKIMQEENKSQNEVVEDKEKSQINQVEEKVETIPVEEKKEEEKPTVEKDNKKEPLENSKEQTASTGITRRSSLRIRSNVSSTNAASTQVNTMKEKLIKKRNEAKKLEEEKAEKDDENESSTAPKRTRKSVLTVETSVETSIETKKPTRGRKSVAPENNDQSAVVEEKPPIRQARVNRRTTIAVAPAQVLEAKQKIAVAARSRKAAGPVVIKEIEKPQEEEEKSTKSRRAASSETSKRKSTTTSNKIGQSNIDTYHYDEFDSNETKNDNHSKRKRKTNVQQDESIIISSTVHSTEDEKFKKRSNSKSNDDAKSKTTKKRNNKKLNASLNVQNTDNEDDNDPLSKTLPFSAKLFFHSKRKSLPSGGSVSSEEQPTKSENDTKNSKRYSYSSLLNNSKLNNDCASAIISASPTKQSSHNQSTNKKFKLRKAKSSSSEESSNDSDSDNEPLAIKKAKQNHSVSFKTPVEEKEPDTSSENAKKATVKRKNTITKRKTAAEVVESVQTASSRNSRNKKASTATPKIMATGIILTEKQKQIIANLGGEIVNDPKDATHLITNKIRKSCKFLSCLNKGVFIVNERWLEESNKAKTFANPSAYALSDSQCEKQYKFSLQTSLLKAKSQQLFQDWKFILIHEDSPQEELSRSDIRIIIECGNGELIDELPTNETELANCCILYTNVAKYKKDTQFSDKDLLKMTLETFLNSILKQSFDIFHKIEQNE
jgi:hypothetical protein